VSLGPCLKFARLVGTKAAFSQAMDPSPMDKFTVLTGTAAPFRVINVDTDMIIPARYLKTIQRTGLGVALFSSMRYDDAGKEKPDFILNKPAYRKATVLIAGDNFGCGSSREHAPWALLDFGIRCVIAPSFADIFFGNCFKNGILPIVQPQAVIDRLQRLADNGANATFTVDLERQRIATPEGDEIAFEVEPFRKQCLLNGWDDIGLTLRNAPAIDTFEDRQKKAEPWHWAR
jgi:3-isopropylmalate/(R)-2-methylmalate dehydratase small subunit